MKKKILTIILFVSSFFFFNAKVNASTSFSINYDDHEHFNYFYEQKNNSLFYQFLISQGSNLRNYFNEHTGFNPHVMLIGYADDINFPNNIVAPADAKYVIFTFSSDSSELAQLYDSSINASSWFFNLSDSTHSAYYHYMFFNSSAEFISSSSYIPITEVYSRFSYTPFNYSVEPSDYSYLLSSFYYIYSSFYGVKWASDTKPLFRLNTLVINDTTYMLDDVKYDHWFQEFLLDLTGFITSTEYKSVSDLGLDYFTKDYYTSSSSGGVSLLNIISNNGAFENYTIPVNYLSQSFSYSDRYYLIPNAFCSVSDSILYFSSSDIGSVNIINYMLQENNTLSTEINSFNFQVNRANSIDALSLYDVVENVSEYAYLLYSSDNFTSNTFYYNPSCFSKFSSVSSTDITFTNINTDTTVTVSPYQQRLLYNNSSKLTLDLVRSDNNTDSVNLSDYLSSAWNGATSFINASFKVLSLSTTMFNSLPSEVGSILILVFTTGMILLIWKLFH